MSSWSASTIDRKMERMPSKMSVCKILWATNSDLPTLVKKTTMWR